MTKAPDDMKQIWVRDEDGTFTELIKQYARRDRRKMADFVRMTLEKAFGEMPPLFFDEAGEKNGQFGR